MVRIGTLIASVVAFGAAAAGAFVAVQSASATGLGPVDCGSAGGCIPVEGAAVLETLGERGFECSAETSSCELVVGSTSYNVSVQTLGDEDLIGRYTVDVRHDAQLGLSENAKELFTWFVTMPFSNDPEADEVSREWLTNNIGDDAETTVRDFDLALDVPEPDRVQLSFDGITPPPAGE